MAIIKFFLFWWFLNRSISEIANLTFITIILQLCHKKPITYLQKIYTGSGIYERLVSRETFFVEDNGCAKPSQNFSSPTESSIPQCIDKPIISHFLSPFSPLTTQNIFVYQLNVTDCVLKGENILWVFWLLDFYPCFNCHHFHRGVYRWQ